MGKLRLAVLIVTFLCCACWAGVVEDAEELLKDLPSDAPTRTALRGSGEEIPRTFPQGVSTVSQAGSMHGSSAVGSSGRGSSGTSATSGGSTATSGSVQAVPAEESEATEHRRRQESKDRALTAGGVLLLLLFIALAGYYSRRLAGSSD